MVISKVYRCRAAPPRLFQNLYRSRTATAVAVAVRQRCGGGGAAMDISASWSQIVVGGSNLGELFGALFVFFSNDTIKSPLLWVRLDALMLLVIWYIPFYHPPPEQVKYAWIIAASLVPIGFASAISDISLDAYIQSSLTRLESKHQNVSPLGAVMAFLYSTYIIIYSISNPLFGRHLDNVYKKNGTIQSALIYTAAAQLTIVCIVMFAATFIPKGAAAFNPVLIDENDETITNNNDETLHVMSDKNGDSNKTEKAET